jgi:hypothetical protein
MTPTVKSITFNTSVGTGTIATGAKKAYVQTPVEGTITQWRLISDVSATVVVDVWKRSNVIPTVANTITGSSKPTLTANTVATSSTLTGWDASVSIGDIFEINVDSNDNATTLTLQIEMVVS